MKLKFMGILETTGMDSNYLSFLNNASGKFHTEYAENAEDLKNTSSLCPLRALCEIWKIIFKLCKVFVPFKIWFSFQLTDQIYIYELYF